MTYIQAKADGNPRSALPDDCGHRRVEPLSDMLFLVTVEGGRRNDSVVHLEDYRDMTDHHQYQPVPTNDREKAIVR